MPTNRTPETGFRRGGIQSLLAPREVRRSICADEPFVPQTIAALERATADDSHRSSGGGGLFMDYFERSGKAFKK